MTTKEDKKEKYHFGKKNLLVFFKGISKILMSLQGHRKKGHSDNWDFSENSEFPVR